jgi:hypothetical protein
MKPNRAKPLAELIEACLAPTLAAQGFASTDIGVGWPELVGERLAAYSQPLKIEWPRRRQHTAPDEANEPAVLVVRVESAFALEVQHLAPVIMERVNARYGYRCIGRIVLKQGPVVRPRPPAPVLADDPIAQAKARTRVGPMEDEALRQALVRLGSGVLADAARRKGM